MVFSRNTAVFLALCALAIPVGFDLYTRASCYGGYGWADLLILLPSLLIVFACMASSNPLRSVGASLGLTVALAIAFNRACAGPLEGGGESFIGLGMFFAVPLCTGAGAWIVEGISMLLRLESSTAPALTGITVRRAGPGDEPILRALRLEALAESPEAFGSTYEREFARTTADWQRWFAPGVTLLLEDSGRARGLVAGMLDARDPSIAHLLAMWIDPALRGSGAANSLVAEHVAWARSTGARSVRIDVFASNPRARGLYERHGFRLTGQQTARDDGRVELQMELPLRHARVG